MFRGILIVVFVCTLGISAYHRHKARRDGGGIARSVEGPLLILLRLGFALPLALALLAYMIHPPWMAWSAIDLPVAFRWVGVCLGLVVVPLAWWVFRSIGRNISETVLTKEHHELVTDGPYRWVRHPLYTVGLVLLTSASLLASNWFIGGMTVMVFVLIHAIVIPKEEANLIGFFGDAYLAYKQRTGRLLPGVPGKRE